MQKSNLLLASIIILVFILTQYAGISSFNIFHNTQTVRIGTSGLVATSVGSDVYLAWTDFTNKGVALASSTINKFKIDKINGYNYIPLSKSIDASGSNVYLAWINNYFYPTKLILSKNNGDSTDTYIVRESNYVLDYPRVESNGPIVYLGWIEKVNNYELLLKYSYDNANTFSNIIRISDPNHNARAFTMVSEGSNLYIAWHQIINGKHKVFLRYSYDNAHTFSNAIMMSEDNDAGFPVIDASGSNVYLAWIEKDKDDRRIVLTISNDAAKSFKKILIENATFPVLDADGPLVCISWLELQDKLNIGCSIDNKNFTKHTINTRDVKMHKIDVEDSNVYLSWIEGDSLKIVTSHDAGKSFGRSSNIANGNIVDAGVIANGRNLYAVWSEVLCINSCHDVKTKVHLKVSYDSGKSFGDTFTLE